jgi:hypothetical protein
LQGDGDDDGAARQAPKGRHKLAQGKTLREKSPIRLELIINH